MAEPTICELHNVALVERTVPLRYGLPAYDPAQDVKKLLFPNSHSYALGGCIIDDEPVPPYKRQVCLECRAAERAWRKENDPPFRSSSELTELFRLPTNEAADTDRNTDDES